MNENKVYLNGILVDSKEIDPSKHKFIGTFREAKQPDFTYFENDIKKNVDVYLCPCGQFLWTKEGVFSHYNAGHMDKLQYIDI